MPADPRWEQLEALFDEAVERPPEERRAWLARACPDDDELRREVGDMVAAHERTAGVLEGSITLPPLPPRRAGPAPTEPAPTEPASEEWVAEDSAADSSSVDGGRTVGPYRLLRQAGRGGMGVVYQARDPRLDRHVALKFLPRQLAEPAAVTRFQAEAKAASALDHPNICTVYDVGETEDGELYIAMAYYEGETVAEHIARGPIAVDEAVDLALQAAAGLDRAHAAGIIHRDVKPANLMVTERSGTDRLKILDFGIAKLEGSRLTKTGSTPGTLAYMAPEQLEGEDVDPRADLWSLGVVLYEMLTGELPFSGAGHGAMIRAILHDPPGSLRSLRPEVPRSLEQVVEKALAKSPEDRQSSSAELIGELEDVRQELTPAGGRSPILMTLVVADPPGRGPDPDAYGGRQIGDGQLLFERPWNAVSWALAGHRTLAPDGREWPGARVGIHLTEVFRRADGGPRVDGTSLALTARLAALAGDRQTLLTRSAFDLARQAADGRPSWLAHGAFSFAGVAEPVEIFEVGEAGVAPLAAPEGGPEARPASPDDTILGWRPAAGQDIALRPHWQLVRKLGEGGFGEVWLASHEKTGERRAFKFCLEARRLRALKREIALFRLLKYELGERGDIARILDWNFDDEPYFIESEYSEDGNLTEWAEEQGGLAQVPLAVRLAIVGQIAEALAAAHSVGVLHKDVKPSNVLIRVDPRGRPRAQLADFGIGMLTDPARLEVAGITMTEASQRGEDGSSGTPLYRAPELLEGKAATLQADVYALGVVLYQMVVGDLHKALGPGWERDVDDELLREDVAVAVDKSPRRRLGNAMRLAERLEALAERRQQRQAERRERQEAERTRAELERSRRRRKAAAVVIIALTVFAGALGWQVHRADREASRANREAETAHQVADFLVRVFEVSDPGSGSGREVTAREVLERGSARLASELRGQPEVRARLMATIGAVYRSLGLYREAAPLIEDALATRRRLWGEEHPEVAQSLDELAELARLEGDYEKAEARGREALEMRRRLLGDEHLDLATSLSTLGLVYAARGDYEAAEPLYYEALEMRRRILGEDPKVARSLQNLAVMFARKGSYEAAEPLYHEALAMHRELSGDDHPEVATTLGNLAAIYYRKGDYAAAEPYAREASEVYRRLLGDEHPDLAWSLNLLGQIRHKQGDLDAAEPLYREALAMRRRLLGDEHPRLANSLISLGWLLREKGEYTEAEALYREALAMRRQFYGDEHAMVANSWSHLAQLWRAKGDFEAAEELYYDVLAMHRRLYGDDHLNVAATMDQLADLFLEAARFTDARDLIREALEILHRSLPADHWQIAAARNKLGAALAGLGSGAEAEALLLDSYRILKEQRGEAAPITRTARLRLATLYESRGETEKAASYQDLR